jgi:hypothetical protein
MNWPQMHADWEELKEVLKTYWGDLSEEDLNAIDGSRDQAWLPVVCRRPLWPIRLWLISAEHRHSHRARFVRAELGIMTATS